LYDEIISDVSQLMSSLSYYRW